MLAGLHSRTSGKISHHKIARTQKLSFEEVTELAELCY